MGFLAEGDRCSNHASKLIYSVFRVLVEVYPFRVIRNDDTPSSFGYQTR